MIAIPEKGLGPSVNKHNCSRLTVADWVISSALFGEEDVSKADLSDILLENQFYRSQDFCSEFIDQVWFYLQGFFDHVNTPSLSIDNRAVRFNAEWSQDPALAYCLVASLRRLYEGWSAASFGDYLVQGAILEHLTQIALSNAHPNFSFKTTGWSGINSNQKFKDLVDQICNDTKFSQLDLELWDNGRVKDLGLDVYGFLPGTGLRPSTNFMMIQCASGDNWEDKRKTPDLDIWEDIVKIYTSPMRGMAIPFFVEDELFKKSLVIIKGPLLDRTELLSKINPQHIPADLENQIKGWILQPINELEYHE